MNNIIKKEFTTIGTIDYESHDLIGDLEYALTICLNNVKERLYLGFFDPCRPDMNLNQKFSETNKYYLKDKYGRYSTPLFNNTQLRNLYNTFHKTSCPQSYIYANIIGNYVFDMDNPDNDHIEVNGFSLIDPPDVSINQSKTYTGIPVAINYKNNTAIITLDTAEITFSCPINTIDSLDLTKSITITVTEHITPTTPRKYNYKIRNQNCHSDLFRVAYILIYCFYTVINGFNNCNCCSLRKFCIYPPAANSESTSENNFSHTSGLVVVRS